MKKTQLTEIPVHDHSIRTYRSLDPEHPNNVLLLAEKEHEKKYKELLDEVKVRFDTNPRFYQKEDYKKLIDLLDESGAASVKEDDLRTIGGESLVGEGDVDFKTINGETITGEGNIEITDLVLTAGNALEIDEDEVISVISHEYNEETNSCIFGKDNENSSLNSIAEGAYTTVKGNQAHASGYETEALGENSFSLGYYTVSNGNNSHSEGSYTTAYGNSSHAEGEGGNITLFKSMTESDATEEFSFSKLACFSDSDSSFNFFAGSDFDSASDVDGVLNEYGVEKLHKLAGWIGRPIYKANGELLAIITDIQGSKMHVDRPIKVNIDQALYIKTGAIGEDSHAEGYLSDASGLHAHAEGERTLATGTNAHSEGYHTKAFGMNSHAEGYVTQALASSSHTEGQYTHAEGEFGHAEGFDTKASGTHSHAEGKSSCADANYSHAEGEDTESSGLYSHSEGSHTEAQGECSHTEGYNTLAIRKAAHAEGHDSRAEAIGSHAEGFNTIATQYANYSHTEGYETSTEGQYAHAEGCSTEAISKGSHAEGISTRADGDYSHTEGIKTLTRNVGEHAQGKCNLSHKNNDIFGNPGNTIFSVGIGNEDRKNAIEIMLNGDVYIKNLAGFDGDNLNNAETLLGYITSSFVVIAAALNDLNNRINELS